MTTKGQFIEKAAPSTTHFSDDGAGANPAVTPETPQEESMWKKASPWVHGALGVASFIPGVSVVSGGVDAAIYAGEGNAVEAGIAMASMIPGGKIVTTAGKVVKGAVGLAKEVGTVSKIAKGAHEAEEVAKAAKLAKEAEEAAKLAKEAQLAKEAKAAKEAEEAAAASKKAKKDTTVKKKQKLKCGEYGKYGELKKKTGGNKFDRDHIPSKAALIKRAEQLNGEELSKAQKKAIEAWGNSISIPKQAHIDASPTYGTKNIALAPKDAKDLAGAARRDVDEMLKKIDEYDADGGCKKAYQKSAKLVLKMSNKDFTDALQKIIDKVK